MEESVITIPSGGVTSPKGFCAGAVAAGIKTALPPSLDLAVLSAGEPVTAAAVFTRNKVKAAPVLVSQRRISGGKAAAIVVNSGCANASAGKNQVADAETMAALVAERYSLPAESVLVASTGVIGKCLPMEKIRAGIGKLEMSETGGHELARAIMTTDTFAKEIAVKAGDFTIGGCAKGSGMIHPDMATLLVFLTTDADVDRELLKEALREAVDVSFNMVTVDGDTSTNDMALLMASGKSGGERITSGSLRAELFRHALDRVCVDLARKIARDGEGATKLIEVNVRGAVSIHDARLAARTIAGSPLVKTAVHGGDPNWGRVLAAAGRSGAELSPDKVDLEIGGVRLVRSGLPLDFSEVDVVKHLNGEEVRITLYLNLGDAAATAWGCDLSKEYVTINADYTT